MDESGTVAHSHDYGDFGEFLRLSTWDGDVRLPKVGSEEPLKAQARQFLEFLRRGGRIGAAQAADDVGAAEARHHDVEQDHVGVDGAGQAQALLPVGGEE